MKRSFKILPIIAGLLLPMLGFIASPSALSAGVLHTFGEGSTAVLVVEHGERLSIYANSVSADEVLEELVAIGGPTFTTVTPLTRPVTLTMHRVRWEDILRKMLQGYSYTITYKGGRIAHVHVMQQIAGRNYKTPPAVESRERWTRIELGPAQD